MTLDPNKTVWQRVWQALKDVDGEDTANRITPAMHLYVVAERHDAKEGTP